MDVVCLVTTNHNGRANGVLDLFLETLNINLCRIEKNRFDLRIFVVDDGSTDDSLKALEKFQADNRDQVNILHTPNLDGNPSLMYGIRHALHEYRDCSFVITFDVDTCLSEDFIQEIIKKVQSANSEVGMIASNEYLLTYYPTKRIHRSTGHFVSAAGATMDRDFLDKDSSQGKALFCPCFSGALLKAEMLSNIGLVPDEYLHYNNCSELGFRAQLADWRADFAENAVMWHRYRPHSTISPEQLRQREISRIWNLLRFFPKERIGRSLDRYRDEKVRTSPNLQDKERYIQEAMVSIPKANLAISEEKKEEIYSKLIARVL